MNQLPEAKEEVDDRGENMFWVGMLSGLFVG